MSFTLPIHSRATSSTPQLGLTQQTALPAPERLNTQLNAPQQLSPRTIESYESAIAEKDEQIRHLLQGLDSKRKEITTLNHEVEACLSVFRKHKSNHSGEKSKTSQENGAPRLRGIERIKQIYRSKQVALNAKREKERIESEREEARVNGEGSADAGSVDKESSERELSKVGGEEMEFSEKDDRSLRWE